MEHELRKSEIDKNIIHQVLFDNFSAEDLRPLKSLTIFVNLRKTFAFFEVTGGRVLSFRNLGRLSIFRLIPRCLRRVRSFQEFAIENL